MVNQQIASKTVANMLDEAKAILKSAKEIADENGVYFSYQDIYEELTDDYGVDWNGSNC
jgi:phosphoribosylformylglycinamidine (FGAM) synthase-like amidotransferase family enzyme